MRYKSSLNKNFSWLDLRKSVVNKPPLWVVHKCAYARSRGRPWCINAPTPVRGLNTAICSIADSQRNEYNYNVAIIAQFTCAPREVKNHHFGFLFSSGPIVIVSYLLTLVYMYIRSIFQRDVQCANGFSVTRPSLNRSFTIKHTVSLPLRRHSCTQSHLATSVKRHSDLIPYLARGRKSRDSRARAVDAHSTFLITDIIK